MTSKQDLFDALIRNENPDDLQRIWSALDIFSLDKESIRLVLAPQDIVAVLQRYLCGELSGEQVEDWANLIEAVSVGVGITGSERILEVINNLANPVLEGSLTPENAVKFSNELLSAENL